MSHKDIAQRRNVEINDLIAQTVNNSCSFYGKAIICSAISQSGVLMQNKQQRIEHKLKQSFGTGSP